MKHIGRKTYFDRRYRVMRARLAQLKAQRKNLRAQLEESLRRRSTKDHAFIMSCLHLVDDRELANEVLRRRIAKPNLLKGFKFKSPEQRTQ